jgi:hypothetical protein
VFWTVALLEARVEQCAETREEYIQCLVQDAVGDAIRTWSLVRRSSAYHGLNLVSGDVQNFDWRWVFVSLCVREIGLGWGRKEGLS